MDIPGHYTRAEIESQPKAWAATLATLQESAGSMQAFLQSESFDRVVLTGCGSPYYLALSLAVLFQELSGRPAQAIPASELWLQPQVVLPSGGRTLLVVLSRSGETTEAIRAVQGFRAAGRGRVLTITSYPDRPLNALGDRHLTLAAGQEQSLAQTRAFTTLQLGGLACAALWSGQAHLVDALAGLPDALRQLLAAHSETIRTLARDPQIDRFYFLGSGARYGLASELSLKMKEMSLSHSEPFHVLEFRHGPKAMATRGALVIGLIGEALAAHELAVLADLRAQGARTLAIGAAGTDAPFAANVPAALSGPLYLPLGQLLAYERALLNGQNPDQPANLTAVVKLDG